MRSVVKLLDVKSVLFEFDYSAFVVVHITVVRCREYGDHYWELRRSVPFVHLVAFELGLVRPQYGQQFIPVQELVERLLPEEVRTPSYLIGQILLGTMSFLVLHRV